MKKAVGCLLMLTPTVLVMWVAVSIVGWSWLLLSLGGTAILFGLPALGAHLLREEEPKPANDNSTAHANTPEAK